MPLNLSATLSAGWLPDDSTFSVLTPERPRAWTHSASSLLQTPQTSFAGEDTGQICDGDGPVACAGKAGESTCKDGKCVCAENSTFVGGTCVLNSNTGLLTYMQKASAELDKLNDQIEVQKAANGGDVDGNEDATAPISSVRALDLQTTMAQMKKRVEQAPKFEDLKRELEGNAATLADTAATSVEFQPSIRSLIREMGPARLEHAVQDMTRGVHAVLNTNKNLQKASVALMTTTDAQLLDGVEESINKALWPLVALRKNLKSIMEMQLFCVDEILSGHKHSKRSPTMTPQGTSQYQVTSCQLKRMRKRLLRQQCQRRCYSWGRLSEKETTWR